MVSVHHNSSQLISSMVQRIERLEEEIGELNADKSEVYKEAKAVGLCTKTLRKLIGRRRMSREEVEESDILLELYERAMGYVKADMSYDPPTVTEESSFEVLYELARDLVVSEKRVSTSFIQRKMVLGYNKAAELIEKLENDGIISPPNKAGKRRVLLNPLDA